MHDRRIDGKTYKFGNQGALFMNAMTWWDHATKSIWSQPWGAAIDGPLTGTQLTLLPFEFVPFSVWAQRHPDTKVLVDERGAFTYPGQIPQDHFVIGVSIGEAAAGFYFRSAANAGVVNENIGQFPVAVFANGDTREIEVFIRRVQDEKARAAGIGGELNFAVSGDGAVTDIETGSTWDIKLGVATSGPLRGTVLQRAPFITSFDWAWEDFFPATTFWGSIDDA